MGGFVGKRPIYGAMAVPPSVELGPRAGRQDIGAPVVKQPVAGQPFQHDPGEKQPPGCRLPSWHDRPIARPAFLAQVLHATVVEVLLFLTPGYRDQMVAALVRALNAQITRFRDRNPGFKVR